MAEEEILFAIAPNKSLVRTKSKEETERDINESAEYIVDPVTKQKYRKRLVTQSEYNALKVKDPGTEYVIVDGTDDVDLADSMKNWLKVNGMIDFRNGQLIQLSGSGKIPNGNYVLNLVIGLTDDYTNPDMESHQAFSSSIPISGTESVWSSYFNVLGRTFNIHAQLINGVVAIRINGLDSRDKLTLIHRSLVRIV